jgi:hypothetical protein
VDEGYQGRQRSGVSDAEVVDLSETRYGLLNLTALLQEQEKWPRVEKIKVFKSLVTPWNNIHIFIFKLK